MFQLVYPIVSFIGIPIAIIFFIWRQFFYKKTVYVYSSVTPILNSESKQSKWPDFLKNFIRLLVMALICIAISRPRIPDEASKITVHGVDIILALDISGSMQLFDDLNDRRSRIEVEKQAAQNFIKKRENDAIGLVVFANGAVSRSPLTTDKKMLQEILYQTNIGTINQTGTTLSRALLAAINRLKFGEAKSKIIILLTDGEPTANDVNPQIAVDLAKKLGIKIYTIGVGSEHGGYYNHPFDGLISTGQILNTKLLREIAALTDGKFFLAQNPKEVEEIYDLIDKMEKRELEVPVYAKYFEYFPYLLALAYILLFIELILAVWWLSL